MELKNWKHYGQTLLVIGIAIALAACGSNKKSSTTPVNGVYGPYPNGYYGDIYMNSNDAGYLGDNFAWRNFTITDGGVFREFIKKVHGVCDRTAVTGGIHSCNNWVNSYFRIVYQAHSSSPSRSRIMFMTYPQTSQYYWYGYQLPSFDQFFQSLLGFPTPYEVGMARNPIALDMTVSNINNSQGFEARAFGAQDTLANRSLIQFQVTTGKVLDQQVSFTLNFEGRPFASGTLYRCTYPDCR